MLLQQSKLGKSQLKHSLLSSNASSIWLKWSVPVLVRVKNGKQLAEAAEVYKGLRERGLQVRPDHSGCAHMAQIAALGVPSLANPYTRTED